MRSGGEGEVGEGRSDGMKDDKQMEWGKQHDKEDFVADEANDNSEGDTKEAGGYN